jgi:hypothetical protein
MGLPRCISISDCSCIRYGGRAVHLFVLGSTEVLPPVPRFHALAAGSCRLDGGGTGVLLPPILPERSWLRCWVLAQQQHLRRCSSASSSRQDCEQGWPARMRHLVVQALPLLRRVGLCQPLLGELDLWGLQASRA